MYNPISKTEDAKAFGADFMRISKDRALQDKVLGELFRALAFGIKRAGEDEHSV